MVQIMSTCQYLYQYLHIINETTGIVCPWKLIININKIVYVVYCFLDLSVNKLLIELLETAYTLYIRITRLLCFPKIKMNHSLEVSFSLIISIRKLRPDQMPVTVILFDGYNKNCNTICRPRTFISPKHSPRLRHCGLVTAYSVMELSHPNGSKQLSEPINKTHLKVIYSRSDPHPQGQWVAVQIPYTRLSQTLRSLKRWKSFVRVTSVGWMMTSRHL